MNQSIRVAVITAPRATDIDVLGRTLQSMQQEDSLAADCEFGVLVDNDRMPLLRPELRVHYMECQSPEILRKLRAGPRGYKGALNLARAMRWTGEADVAVVCEDDYLMHADWLHYGLACLRAVIDAGYKDPYVCMSDGWPTPRLVEMYDPTGIDVSGIALWKVTSRTTSTNGYSPCFMLGSTALRMAPLIEDNWADLETDVGLVGAAYVIGSEGFACDPCVALHMNVASTHNPNRNPYDAEIKRYMR